MHIKIIEYGEHHMKLNNNIIDKYMIKQAIKLRYKNAITFLFVYIVCYNLQ